MLLSSVLVAILLQVKKKTFPPLPLFLLLLFCCCFFSFPRLILLLLLLHPQLRVYFWLLHCEDVSSNPGRSHQGCCQADWSSSLKSADPLFTSPWCIVCYGLRLLLLILMLYIWCVLMSNPFYYCCCWDYLFVSWISIFLPWLHHLLIVLLILILLLRLLLYLLVEHMFSYTLTATPGKLNSVIVSILLCICWSIKETSAPSWWTA